MEASDEYCEFVSDKIRVGQGGKFLKLRLINDSEPVTLKNIKDGETLYVRAVEILDTDCKNIVIFQ